MHVGVVTPRYPPSVSGGGEVSVQMLAEQLHGDRRVDSVTVLSFDGWKTETVDGVDVVRLGDVSPTLTEWQNLRAYRRLKRNVAQRDIDIIHAYNMELHPAVGRLGSKTGIETVATLNSYHFFPKSVANTPSSWLERVYELIGYPTTGQILRQFMSRIDTFVALSSTIERIYIDHGLSPEQIEIIPNMYDPSFSVPSVEADSDGPVRLLNVGSLTEIKGVRYLVEAMPELSAEFELRVVGDGPQLSEMKALSRELGVEESISFSGHIPYEQIPAEYARADIFVHPGVWPEPFSRTVVEAMQAGLPVVSTEVGGHTDVIQDSELLCRSKDPEALADGIERAADDRAQYGQRNQEYVTEHLAPSSVIERIVDLYERRLSSER